MDLVVFMLVAFGGVFGLIAYVIHWSNQKNGKNESSATEQNVGPMKQTVSPRRPKGCLYNLTMLILAVIFFAIAAMAWILWENGG